MPHTVAASGVPINRAILDRQRGTVPEIEDVSAAVAAIATYGAIDASV